MNKNEYVPRGLPLITDQVLIKTYKEYHQARLLLSETSTSASLELKKKLDEAVELIQEELLARGVYLNITSPPLSLPEAPRPNSLPSRKHREKRAKSGYYSSNYMTNRSTAF